MIEFHHFFCRSLPFLLRMCGTSNRFRNKKRVALPRLELVTGLLSWKLVGLMRVLVGLCLACVAARRSATPLSRPRSGAGSILTGLKEQENANHQPKMV
jgi:hypothetical protein